jgi:hypothetical protein
MTLRISSSWFVAGLVFEAGRCVRAAPILAYALGWDHVRAFRYFAGRGFDVGVL